MTVSKRKIRLEFKNALPERTHIREGVEDAVAEIMQRKLKHLINRTIQEWEKSDSNAIRVNDVWVAYGKDGVVIDEF